MNDYKRLTIRLSNGKIGCLQEYSQKDLITRLAELEDKIENGTLMEIPCKVGDDAYFVVKHKEDYVLEEGYVRAINIDKDGIWVGCYYNSGFSYLHKHKDKNLFYKTAEAEAKLKELQGE